MRTNENISAKNEVEKKRKIAEFITKKKIDNNCLRKAIDLKKSKKNNRVGLELLTQSFEDRKAHLTPYTDKYFFGRITEELRYSLHYYNMSASEKTLVPQE